MITFSTSRELSSSLELARQDLLAWEVSQGTSGERLAEWLGEDIEPLMLDLDAVVQSLRSHVDRVRLGAIALVATYWPPNERLASEALRLAFEDTEPAIRGAAFVAVKSSKKLIADPSGFLTCLLSGLFGATENDRVPNEGVRDVAFVAWILARVRQLASTDAQLLLEDRAAAEACLAHAQPRLRQAAIWALAYHWRAEADFLQKCEKLALHDQDCETRCAAITVLAGRHTGTDEASVGGVLARIVADNSQPASVRTCAYRGLLLLHGGPCDSFMHSVSDQFRIPDDIDWRRVEPFLSAR